jgi:hypothetical protein
MASKSDLIERAARRMLEDWRRHVGATNDMPWESLSPAATAGWLRSAASAWDAFAESIPELRTIG